MLSRLFTVFALVLTLTAGTAVVVEAQTVPSARRHAHHHKAKPIQPGTPSTVKARPGRQKFTTTDALVAVKDGPGNAHATTIDTRLYRPKNATAKHPQPAIVMTHGFGLTKASPEVVNTASFLASHGYVVLTFTAQGFGKSTGCIALDSRTYDVKDEQQIIDQLLEPKKWVKHDRKGVVAATVGGSYGGGIQANIAETDPRIRAIVPSRTWNTLQYSLDPNNWVAPGDPTGFTHDIVKQGVFKKLWTTLFFALGTSSPTSGGGCTSEIGGSGDPACVAFYIAVCEVFAKLTATGDADDAARALVADSSGSTEIDKLRVPTLLTQGQRDTLFNVNDAVATYLALRRNKVPVKMIWNWGGHGGYNSQPGECEPFAGGGAPNYKDFDRCYLPLRILAFLDHWLKGKPDHSPGFTWFRDWAPYDGKGPSTSYAGAASFPLKKSLTFNLTAGNELATTAPMSDGSVTIINPPGGQPAAYTEASNFTAPGSSPNLAQEPTDIAGQFAHFTTAPFASPVTVVGVPALHVTLSHIAPTDLVIFAKAWDVAPDGTATLINRLIAPSRIPSAALSAPVDLKLIGFAHKFDAGHSLRITLCTTDQTSYNNPVPDTITITTGPGATLTVPVL